MMVKYIMVILLIVLFKAGSANDSKELYLPADPLKGEIHFTQKGCNKCHAIEGYGGSFGPDLARSDFSHSMLDIIAKMWNHSPQMSSMMGDLKLGRPKFSGTELAELAVYLYYIAYFDKPGDIAKGKRVFSQKGCSNCHRAGGIGTQIGPSLSPIKKYVSSIFMAQEMWNHGPSIKEKMKELNISWPIFEGKEISDLLAFLRDASTDPTSERIFMHPGNPQVGEQLFQKKRCITCHRVFGEGKEIGPDLKESTFHKSVTSVAADMWNHGPVIWERMKEIGLKTPTFKGNEMADLIAFLYFLPFFEKEPNVARGEMLFNQKGCQKCHHFGKAVVEDSYSLSSAGSDLFKLDLAADMWNHAEVMSETMVSKKLKWNPLQNGEMNDLIEYILSHRNNGNKK